MSMVNHQVYAFIDESGNTAANCMNRYLILAALLTKDPLSIQRNVIEAERKIRKRMKNTREIKAFKQSELTRKIFLNNLVKANFEIFSVAFDLSSIKRMPYNVDTVYSFGMSLLCRNVFSYKQNVSFVIDKRYSNEKLRNNLNSEIFQMRLDTGLDVESVTNSHEESIENHSLRAVDFIAYEIYQKLKKGDNLFDIISPYVGNYVYYKDISWEKIKKESKTPQKDHPELRFQSLPQHFS